MKYVDWKETLVFNSSIGTGQGTLINIGICKFSTEGFIGSQVSTTVWEPENCGIGRRH